MTGFQIPADTRSFDGQKGNGFATPTQDKRPQTAAFLPKRVIPVIFLPGIMGSNLRITEAERQSLLHQKDNKAWRPDDLNSTNVGRFSRATPRERQLRLDPTTTVVDIYDPSGPKDVSGDGRHKNVVLGDGFASPLLADDAPGPESMNASQKARQRGWGEMYYKSYGELLQHLESRLNNTFWDGKVQAAWKDVVGVDPSAWQPHPSLPQKALTDDELKKVATGCWFPVYAFGYNWLQSNGESARSIAKRITAVIDTFTAARFHCDKVIVVTHSMGGLVARALIHPDYGNLQDKVLGIVHGAQPAIGAAAAYKRIRAGFEDPGLMGGLAASIGAKVAGNFGDEVTAVLANSPGGLELLPNEAYGSNWLKVTHNGKTLDSWPKDKGGKVDPYEDIYKVRGKWYLLIRDEWINPSGLPENKGGGSFSRTSKYIDHAKELHQSIADTYHSSSYAHYGADPKKLTFGEVIWNIETKLNISGWDSWLVRADSRQGRLALANAAEMEKIKAAQEAGTPVAYESGMETAIPADGDAPPEQVHATILPPAEPGDQTVPIRSSDHQLNSHKFLAIFRQTGYDHQGSYQNAHAVASTLYSIVRIAQQAEWSGR